MSDYIFLHYGDNKESSKSIKANGWCITISFSLSVTISIKITYVLGEIVISPSGTSEKYLSIMVT